MECVDGTSLEAVLRAAQSIPLQRAIPLFLQVCAALSAAHQKGIVHRDLKPSNILLTTSADGNFLVKVLDFGIAKIMPGNTDSVLKLTQTGETLGSLLYMSPEQCLDRDLDARSDCYSLGCVMYETLTGIPPLVARTAFETMNKQISEMPDSLSRVRPDIAWPPALEKILFKALAKEPKDRYQSINFLQDDLQLLPLNTVARPGQSEHSFVLPLAKIESGDDISQSIALTSPQVLEAFQSDLMQDEEILWGGQSEQRFFNAKDFFLVPFGLFFFCFSLFWILMRCRSVCPCSFFVSFWTVWSSVSAGWLLHAFWTLFLQIMEAKEYILCCYEPACSNTFDSPRTLVAGCVPGVDPGSE